MYSTMDTDIPTFERCEVDHSDFGTTTANRFINRRLAKRRCELERDMHNRLRERKQSRGLLRSHSIFLERKSKLCFYGYHFKECVKKDMLHLTDDEVEELSQYLFRLKYIVPVMKFVTEMSPTTVFYRYAEDERRLAPSLLRERISCSELARHLMDRTTDRVVAGNRLLELIDTHVADWSVDLVNNQQFVTTQRNRLTMLCQQMLHHGNLIPECRENPERFQKFRPENNYYLCDSEESRDHVRQLQEDKKQRTEARTRHLSDNARALGRLGDYTLRRTSNGSKCDAVFYTSTLRKVAQPKQHTLRRSVSLRSRKKSKANLYWTMEVERKTTAEVNTQTQTTSTSELLVNPGTREVKRQLSARIMAADVEVVHTTENIQTYAPPQRKTSFPDKLKRIYKKLVGVRHNINTCNGTLTSVSSIDAEWSVY